ncbi:hypothetical protein F1640_08790 [Novosphingobium sp. NBM11]|nr:hypothetical protein [Novosphingobium sp. NBM11]
MKDCLTFKSEHGVSKTWCLTLLNALREAQRPETRGRCGANEIVAAWTASLKTARRDIAILRAANLISYIGSRRKGRYRTTPG